MRIISVLAQGSVPGQQATVDVNVENLSDESANIEIGMVARDEGLFDPNMPVQHVEDIFVTDNVVYTVQRQ